MAWLMIYPASCLTSASMMDREQRMAGRPCRSAQVRLLHGVQTTDTGSTWRMLEILSFVFWLWLGSTVRACVHLTHLADATDTDQSSRLLSLSLVESTEDRGSTTEVRPCLIITGRTRPVRVTQGNNKSKNETQLNDTRRKFWNWFRFSI